jgi:N-hydroxyarylamine O-acetyltransferase
MNTAQVDAYLARIEYQGARSTTAETLAALHRAHLVSVPFENLDIARGKRIELSESALFEKIVARRRGGFCYELNGLFALLLEALGFQVTRLSAGVYGPAGSGPEFDHLALRVDLEERFLVDVGFGDSFLSPLRFDSSEDQGGFRLREAEDRRVLEAKDAEGAYQPSYSISPIPRQLSDFEGMCDYHQTSPDSHFTRGSVCSLAAAGGRVTLRETRLIVTEGGARSETALDEAGALAALATHFGISLEQ